MISTKPYKYVIIGSGISGATLAKELLAANRNEEILILEAGPIIEAENRRYWWDFIVQDRRPYDFTYDRPDESVSVGKTPFLIKGSRVTAYGGSTVHWGGWSLRFNPEDFYLKSNTGDGGDWPISYDDLEPFYCTAEQYLSVCGDDTESWNRGSTCEGNPIRSKPFPLPPFEWTAADGEMIEAFEKHGIEPGKMPIARYRKCMTTGTCKYCPFGSRFSAQYVLHDLQTDSRHNNFEVRSNSPVVQVLMKNKRKAIGVEYLCTITGDHHKVHGDNILVCSGAYETPKLLLNSGRQHSWENGIGNDEELLGKFVVSHSILSVRGRLSHNIEQWFQEYDFPTLMSRSWDTEAIQKKSNKVFLFKNRKLPNIDFSKMMVMGKTRREIEVALTESRQSELQAFMEEKGRVENRLQVKSGRNRFGLPNMKVNFTRPEQTRKNGEAWLDRMQKVIETMGYKVEGRKFQDPGGHHMTGTCRMGRSDTEGVTDKNLLVFGTENIYVCSNAVFPTGSAVNPTLTLAALAFRLGYHLTGKKAQ